MLVLVLVPGDLLNGVIRAACGNRLYVYPVCESWGKRDRREWYGELVNRSYACGKLLWVFRVLVNNSCRF